jgi:hypothetical protein
MNVLPSSDAIVKGVVITAISLVIINMVKPHLPAAVTRYL